MAIGVFGTDRFGLDPYGSSGLDQISFVVPSYLGLRIYFDSPMTNDEELVDPANYWIWPLGSEDTSGCSVIDVTPEDVDYPTYVDLNCTDLTNGDSYQLEIVPDALTDQYGEPLPLSRIAYIGVSLLPIVQSVVSISETVIEVVFNKDMANDDELVDITNYSFDNNLTIIRIERVSPQVIHIYTSAQSSDVLYTLTISNLSIHDVWYNELVTESVTALGWREAVEEFQHDIYSFYLSSIRDLDQQNVRLLYRWLMGMQLEWETIYAKILALPDLYSPYDCPDWALEYLKDNVGITDELEYLWGSLDTVDKRRLIKNFVRFLMLRSTNAGYIDMLEGMTGNPVYLYDYFDFRWIVSGEYDYDLETALGREELGKDPWLIHEPEAPVGIVPYYADVYRDVYTFRAVDTLNLRIPLNPIPRVRVTYKPTGVSALCNLYFDEDDMDWFVFAAYGERFGQEEPYSSEPTDFQISIEPDEYVFDIRVVDDNSMNVEMFKSLTWFARPLSERIYIRYYSMLEKFESLDLWTTSGATLSDNVVTLTDTSDATMESAVEGDEDWSDYNVSVKAANGVAESYFEIRFMKQDDDNYCYLRVTPGTPPVLPAGTWELGYVVSGVNYDLDDGTLDWFDVDVDYFWRIVAVVSGTQLIIQGYQDENLLFNHSATDPWSETKGKIEFVAEANGEVTINYCDVHPFPMESDYVGL